MVDTAVRETCDPTTEIVVLPRNGRPPLRFRGRRMSRHQRTVADASVEISLWEKPKRGYVLSHSALSQGEVVLTALSLISLSDAMEYVEDLCRTLDHQQNLPAKALSQGKVCMIETLDFLCRSRSFRQTFSTLAGEALASWDAPDFINEAAKI